ncbi:hypothetical protein KUTeg_022421 [Tegillarca granosa]|uniref:EF-hand domain-containing protein n=1 Tax=Tegillarca granosa TaxID=220873 RepID=A0ABQ9EAJ2_TEGGR|nr:hypothetical protein KUTeg_022421 [Tegillarca granosa]
MAEKPKEVGESNNECGQSQRKSQSDTDLKQIFEKFDKDGNGTISKTELKESLNEMGEEMTDGEVDEMFRKVDFNKNGRISFREFKTLIEDR